jgi:tetratricopeptide (TPR) repeat protein
MVRDSSAYVGIISHKYGQILRCPKRNPDNISITELEFVEAQRLGRPILLFIMGDKHPVIKADVETNATKRKKLKAFRERAKKMKPDSEVHRVYAIFESLEDFTQKSHQALANLRRYLDEQVTSFGRHAPEFMTTPAVAERYKAVPSSLPSQPYFFGRAKELCIIAEAIAPEARTWGALIDGPGGIGKTALAIRAAHVAPESHFDRKIFLSAKVRELTPQGEQPLEDFMLPNYVALLTELARELGDDNIERIDPNERTSAVRRALADVRVLIVVDNVETFPESERVRLYQFLSRLPTTSKAIVTSRRRADIDARVLRLDRLVYKDAVELLTELAKNNRHLLRATEQEYVNLYEITNGNPQLLKWTVGQLGRSGSQLHTVSEAAEFLTTAPASNDPLEYIFGDLLDTFTESETTVLAALAHFKEPAQSKCIADVTGLAENVALTALEDLTDRALLLSNEAEQAFLLPVLAASFLRRKCVEIVANTGDRITDRAFTLAIENGYQQYDRFSRIESEWPIMAAALPMFVSGENNRLQNVCDALNRFLHFSGRWDESLALNQKAEKKAVAVGDLYNAGSRAYQAGYIYFVRRQGLEVLASAERCALHWESFTSSVRNLSIHLRGQGHSLLKDYTSATEAFQEALQIAKSIRTESSEAIILCSLAEVRREQEDFAGAENLYLDALRIAKRNNDLHAIAYYEFNLANLALDREDWSSAETLARDVLALAQRFVGQEMVGQIYRVLGTALIKLGNLQEGLPYARRAVQIFSQLRMPRELEQAQAELNKCAQ